MKTITLPHNAIYAGNLILVNLQHPFFSDASASHLIPVHSSCPDILLEQRAVNILSYVMKQICGWDKISAVSGWRSALQQQEIYENSLKEHDAAFTAKYVALPGHSEHQTGLAIDLALTKKEIDFICPDFPYTGICQTFRERSVHFGFIERYPQSKENATGIGHEPWHFRYVGIPHSEIMDQLHLVLEEYIDFLKQYLYGEKYYTWHTGCHNTVLSYLPAANAEAIHFAIDDNIPYSISGNNIDGFIITQYLT